MCVCLCVSKCVQVFVFHLLSYCFSLSLPFFISLLLDARSKMIFIFVAGSLKGFFLWSLYACLDFQCSSFARSFSHWSFVFMLVPFDICCRRSFHIVHIHSRAVRILFHHFSNISYRYSFHIFLCCFNWLMDMLLCIFDFQTTFFPIYFLFLAFLSERLKSTNFNNERMKMTAMSRIFFFGITSSLQAVQLFDRFWHAIKYCKSSNVCSTVMGFS